MKARRSGCGWATGPEASWSPKSRCWVTEFSDICFCAQGAIVALSMRASLSGLLLLLSSVQALAVPSCPIPEALNFRVEKEIHRDALGFTEGLEVHDGAIWESTGDFFGESRLNRIDPDTGHVTTLLNAGKHYFGEGMTFFGGRLYQMTWREHRVFVFDHQMQ